MEWRGPVPSLGYMPGRQPDTQEPRSQASNAPRGLTGARRENADPAKVSYQVRMVAGAFVTPAPGRDCVKNTDETLFGQGRRAEFL